MSGDACTVCGLAHAPGEGWEFCPERPDLETDAYMDRARTLLAGLPSNAEREEGYWQWRLHEDNIPGPSLAEAAYLGLSIVVGRLLSSRADPNEIFLPIASHPDIPGTHIFAKLTPLHRALDPQIQAPIEAIAKCVQLLVEYKGDVLRKSVHGATPMDLLLYRKPGQSTFRSIRLSSDSGHTIGIAEIFVESSFRWDGGWHAPKKGVGGDAKHEQWRG